MTVQVYKPVWHSSKPAEPSSRRRASRPNPVNQAVMDVAPTREIRHSYTPISPRLDLILAIEELTHPDSPTFDELEAIINSEELVVVLVPPNGLAKSFTKRDLETGQCEVSVEDLGSERLLLKRLKGVYFSRE